MSARPTAVPARGGDIGAERGTLDEPSTKEARGRWPTSECGPGPSAATCVTQRSRASGLTVSPTHSNELYFVTLFAADHSGFDLRARVSPTGLARPSHPISFHLSAIHFAHRAMSAQDAYSQEQRCGRRGDIGPRGRWFRPARRLRARRRNGRLRVQRAQRRNPAPGRRGSSSCTVNGTGGRGGNGGGANANCLIPVGASADVIGQGGPVSQCNGGAGGAGGNGVGRRLGVRSCSWCGSLSCQGPHHAPVLTGINDFHRNR